MVSFEIESLGMVPFSHSIAVMTVSLTVLTRLLPTATTARVRFSSSSSQVQKIWVRFGFGSYILSFEFGSVLYEFDCLTVLNLTVPR